MPDTPTIQPLPEPKWLPKQHRDQAKAINKRIDALAKRHEEADQRQRELERTDPINFDASLIEQRDAAARQRFELLRDELTLRRELEMFYQEAEANRAEATENALAAINKAYQDVKAKLESIGYVDTGDKYDSRVSGSIAPGDIHKHPDMVQAREHHQHLQNLTWPQSHARTNATAIQTLQTHLTQFRTQALTG